MLYRLLLTLTGLGLGIYAVGVAARAIPGPAVSLRDLLDWYERARLTYGPRLRMIARFLYCLILAVLLLPVVLVLGGDRSEAYDLD